MCIRDSIDVDGQTTLDDLNVSGVSTFAGVVDINNNVDVSGYVDVDGQATLDDLNVSGVSTFNDDVTFVGQNYNAFWDKSDNSLRFTDNSRAKFGDHSGTGDLHITQSIEEMEGAYDDWKQGKWSQFPYVDMCIPSINDPTMAPQGKHYMSCLLYTSPSPRDGLLSRMPSSA